MSMNGSTLPFPLTQADREQSGDQRLSIAERYASKAAYLEKVRESARRMIAERHMLAEDLEGVVERGAKRWDWIHSL